jgi:DNA-binding CsgD family transcriptional regulator/catechol 2,3-dioxygenase-like lactoylglutathione lyase family enzyme
MATARGRPRHNDRLTPAEWRTVDAVRHGLKNRQIAALRKISIDAVKFHVANAIAKLGLRNRKALRAWRGAPIESVLCKEGAPVNDVTDILGIGQVSRTVSELPKAESWYRDVLGLKHLYTFGNLAFFDCGGTRLMLSQNETIQKEESLLYLRVANIDAAYSQLSARGVDFVGAPHMIHRHDDGVEEWMAFFKDPEGRHLAIMSSIAQKSAAAT